MLGVRLNARTGELLGQQAWYFEMGGYRYAAVFNDFGNPRSLADYQARLHMPEGPEDDPAHMEEETRHFYTRRAWLIEQARKQHVLDTAGAIRLFIHDETLARDSGINRVLARLPSAGNPPVLEHRILGELLLMPTQSTYKSWEKPGPTDAKIEQILFDLAKELRGKHPLISQWTPPRS